MIPKTMRAVVIDHVTPAEEIRIREVPVPEVKPGWVLIRVKAFGMNHSEQVLRMYEINEDYIQKPVIPGIECVGEVADPSDSGFPTGQKVCALMGGMGRSFNGSYAEYALLPENHVFPVTSSLSWTEMAAVPETYFTAWGSLFQCLHLKEGERLLIRGATCALGYAAAQIARTCGAYVIGTTHRKEKMSLLKERVDEIVLDEKGYLSDTYAEKADKALELIGPRTLKDTLSLMNEGGVVCDTGILGNVFTLSGFDPIKEIPNGVYLTGFYSNTPDQIVMNDIFLFLEEHHLKPETGKVYPFSDIRRACMDLDHHQTDGKIVITMEDA